MQFARTLHQRVPKASIRFYLIAMVCAVALPVLAFVGLLLVQLQVNEQAGLENRAEREAQLLANAAARSLQEMSTTLKLLVTSPELDAGDLKAFHNRAQAALRGGSLFVLLVTKDGQQLLNTRVPYGTPLGKTSNMPALESALRSGQMEVSDIFLGRTSGHQVFNVTMPLPDRLSSLGAALILTKNADDLVRLANTEGLPQAWSAALLDGSGEVVASSQGGGADYRTLLEKGKPVSFNRFSGVAYSASQSQDSIIGYAKLRDWNWTAIVWGPVATAQASILTTWRQLIFGGIALLSIAVAAAIYLARQLRVSIRGIAEMADQVGHGKMVAPITSQIVEIDMVAKALSGAAFDRSQAEDQIRLMLRELAHRTKNLLAVTQAMVHQTSRHSKNVEDFKVAVAERIAGLGRSTDLLTSTHWSGVPLVNVLRTHLATFVGSPQQLTLEGENFELRAEAVQNLGLILHELGTNATKYGALSVPGGRVLVKWDISGPETEAPELHMAWQESGGPPAAAPEEKGFGSQILERHAAAAFRGKVNMDFGTDTDGHGRFVWSIRAPLRTFTEDPGDADQAG